MKNKKSTYLYARLDVTSDATQAEIKKAYKFLAGIYHPDREGGDAEMFKSIKFAYDILKDPAKRKVYDETGVIEEANQDELEAYGDIFNLLAQIIDQTTNVENTNIIQTAKNATTDTRHANQRQIAMHQEAIQKREKVAKKILRKNSGENLLVGMIANQIQSIKKLIGLNQKAIDKMDRILTLLEDYETDGFNNTGFQTNVSNQHFIDIRPSINWSGHQ